MWLFALSAYDALSGVPNLAWGTPLVVAGVYFIFYTLYQGYKDYSELQRDVKETDQECHDASSTVADLGGQDGGGVDAGSDNGGADAGGADNRQEGSVKLEPPPAVRSADEESGGSCIDVAMASCVHAKRATESDASTIEVSTRGTEIKVTIETG